MSSDKNFYELKESISKETKIVKEINSFLDEGDTNSNEENNMISSQINLLKDSLRKENANISKMLSNISLIKLLPQTINQIKSPVLENKTLNRNKKTV